MAEHKLVGQNYATPDLVAKVTGQSKYAEDFRAVTPTFAPLFVSLPDTAEAELENNGGFFGQVLALIRARTASLTAFAKPSLRKHVMHLAALIGVVGFAGGFMPMQRTDFNFGKASAVSGALLSGLSLLFVFMCVRSFIAARKSRQTSP